MDLNDYWQENKRFVTSVGVGAVAFLVGVLVIDSMYADDIAAAERRKSGYEKNLKKELLTASDLTEAKRQNEELLAAVATLQDETTFRARPEFVLPDGVSAANHYLRVLSDVREDLLPRANRANLTVDAGLGMPKLSPTREDKIERYLQALDVIETVLGKAIDARVRRVDKLQIRLDPGLDSRAGIGRIERTKVKFTMSGSSLSLTAVLSALARPTDGRILHMDEVEMNPARGRDDEVNLDVTVVIPRLSLVEEEEE
jgi:hypothetical protein